MSKVTPLRRIHTEAAEPPPEVPILTGLPFNDIGNAHRLERMYGKDLRFVPAWNRWLIWDGNRWAPDDTGEVHRRVMRLSRELQRQAINLENEDQRAAETKWSLRLGNNYKIESTLAVAGKLEGIATDHNDLDRDPFLLGVENGTIELTTGRFRESRRQDLITKVAGAPYEPSASCPKWQEFLHAITEGDDELVRFLQQAVGYSLTGVTSEQCMFFCHGQGRNGKSTFIEAIADLLNDYAQGAPESLFTKSYRGGDQATNDMAALCGSRFAYGVELEEGAAMAESKIKRLTGGDRITARELYKDWFTFSPSHTLWVSGNHKPSIKGTDEGIWRRMRLIEFNMQIPDDVVDPALPDQLRKELSGILNWAIEGCLKWQKHGLITPSVVAKATEEYRSEEDLLGQFLVVHTRPDEGERARKSDVFERYTHWGQEEGLKHPLTKNKFTTKMKVRGFKVQSSNGIDYWEGLVLIDDQEGGYQ